MHMKFWFGYDIQEFLFHSLNISSVAGLVATCIVLFILAVLFELLKLGLAEVKLHSSMLRASKLPDHNTENSVLIQNEQSHKKRWLWFSLEMVLYAVEVIIGYFLMLVVMTYNVYILVAVVIGAGLGYALMGQKLLLVRIKTAKLKVPCQACSSPDIRNVSRGSSCSNTMTETTGEFNCSTKSLSPQVMSSPT